MSVSAYFQDLRHYSKTQLHHSLGKWVSGSEGPNMLSNCQHYKSRPPLETQFLPWHWWPHVFVFLHLLMQSDRFRLTWHRTRFLWPHSSIVFSTCKCAQRAEIDTRCSLFSQRLHWHVKQNVPKHAFPPIHQYFPQGHQRQSTRRTPEEGVLGYTALPERL